MHKIKLGGLIALGVVLAIAFIGFLGSILSGEKPPDGAPPIPNPSSTSAPPPVTDGKPSTQLKDPSVPTELYKENFSNLVLPSTLEYTGMEQTPGQSFIGIGNMFKVKLSKNWFANIDSNKLSILHEAGASVQIVQSRLKSDASLEQINKDLDTFITSCGYETAYISDVFLGDKTIGRFASLTYESEGRPYVLDCSIFVCIQEVYTLVSVYPTDTEEYVNALYSSISYENKDVKLK